MERKVRRAAAARGLNEAVTWSFLPEREAEHFAEGNGGLWILENPISEDMKAMRPSLLPGLLAAAKRNSDRGADGVRLFELGRRYLRGSAGRSDERATLGVLLAGEKTPRGWASGKAAAFDAFDAKAEALTLLEAAGAPMANLMVMGEAGRSFIRASQRRCGLVRRTFWRSSARCIPRRSPRSISKGPSWRPRLLLDARPARKGAAVRRPARAPALQAVSRDFAFLVDAGLPAGDLLRAVKGADKANIVDARVFATSAAKACPRAGSRWRSR